jgi:hypothetical protein
MNGKKKLCVVPLEPPPPQMDARRISTISTNGRPKCVALLDMTLDEVELFG